MNHVDHQNVCWDTNIAIPGFWEISFQVSKCVFLFYVTDSSLSHTVRA